MAAIKQPYVHPAVLPAVDQGLTLRVPEPGAFKSDLAMINWPGNDACARDYLSDDPLAAAEAFQYGRQLAAGFAWWLKNEAPRDASRAKGFPELVLRSDVMGTSDGLSVYPYIRESRRIAAVETIREQDLAEPWHRAPPGPRSRARSPISDDLFVSVDTADHMLLPGDVLLLCSDGLHNSTDGSELARHLGPTEDLEAATRQLVALANQRDGGDNITAQAIGVTSVERMGMYRGRPYRVR